LDGTTPAEEIGKEGGQASWQGEARDWAAHVARAIREEESQWPRQAQEGEAREACVQGESEGVRADLSDDLVSAILMVRWGDFD
jgi:hypothetical protein